MLRPTECITDCRCLVRTRSGNKSVRNLVKKSRGDPANLLHHFRRVAGKVATQRLENAARILQGQVAFWKTEVGMAFVSPGLFVVGSLLFVPAGEKPGLAFFGVAKIFAQNA